MTFPQIQRSRVTCDVHFWMPLRKGSRHRFHNDLYEAGPRHGVSGGGCEDGSQFIVFTQERDEETARDYARMVFARAVKTAGLRADEFVGSKITATVKRRRRLTGRPRPIGARPGRYRTVDLPDGRKLRAMHEGTLGEWILYVEPNSDRAVAARDLLSALASLLGLPKGRNETWVYDVTETLAGHNTSLGVRYACACCDCLTLVELPPWSYEICSVCRWEQDVVQFDDINYDGGANGPSLLQARANFRSFGASNDRRLERVRPPLPEEIPEGS